MGSRMGGDGGRVLRGNLPSARSGFVVVEGTRFDHRGFRSRPLEGFHDADARIPPGPVEVFLNGRRILATENIPSGELRRFKVPKGVLEKGL